MSTVGNILLDLWPKKWLLPGEKASGRKGIKGPALNAIVHALTYYGLPFQVDGKIDALLEKQAAFDALPQLQKDYLSFTVYSVKSMVAAGTISAETAWALFDGEWGEHVQTVTEDNFVGFRTAFFEKTLASLEGNKRQAWEDKKCEDLLQFEFWARAGEAGLAQFERYDSWELKFEGEPLCPTMQQEYRKALWLEMRSIEGELEYAEINANIESFILNRREGKYINSSNTVKGAVDLWSPIDATIDAPLKAEIGHWFFDLLSEGPGWACELMDRMNMAGYTAKGIEQKGAPISKVFWEGGYFLSANGERFPTYPDNLKKGASRTGKYFLAESLEKKIREKIKERVDINRIKREDAYALYRATGFYVGFLALERKSFEEIMQAIEDFDIAKIKEAKENILEKVLHCMNINSKARGKAAAVIIARDRPEKGPDHDKLFAFVLVGKRRINDAAALGKPAQQALEKAAKDKNEIIRMDIASALGKLKDIASIPILIMLLEDPVPLVRCNAARALGLLGHISARPALEKAQEDVDERVRIIANKALGKILAENSSSSEQGDSLLMPVKTSEKLSLASLVSVPSLTAIPVIVGAVAK